MLSLTLFQENTRVLSVNQSHAVCHTAYSLTLLVCCWLAAGHLKPAVWNPALNQLIRVTNTLGSLPILSLAEVPLGFQVQQRTSKNVSQHF